MEMLGDVFAINHLSWGWQAVLRLLAAAVLGAVVGAEREHRGRNAGLRTQILVALGAALAMIVSVNFSNLYGGANARTAVQVDPARVAYGVMAGIGFLGAGAIVRYGASVRGLTTAASLWCTAAVGLACGLGMIAIALVATLLVLFALLVLYKIDQIMPSWTLKTLTITIPLSGDDNLTLFRSRLKEMRIHIFETQCNRNLQTRVETLTFQISMTNRTDLHALLDMGALVPDTISISLE